MGKQVSHLIIGNGIAGITAAEILSTADKHNAITMIADDPSPVYYRPALKDFLGGHIVEEKLWARPNTFYQQHGIRFVPGRVAAISPARHIVQLQDGEQIAYDKLLLANGARPLQLNCPGTDLAGVTTLRTIADYQETLRRLPQTARVVICGSGTLALESAETLCQRGYQVTHLLRKQSLWSAILDSTASDMVLQEERRAGINVRTEETIVEIIGKRGQVTHVVTSTGARIPCDLLLIAIGIAPNIDFIRNSGIACQRGVRVDAAMRTNTLDIYAAGDVIETTDAITGQTRVLGQWFPAIQQARTAAYSMLDRLTDSNGGTFFNATFLCGLDFVSLGVTLQSESTRTYQEIIAEPAPRSYRKVLLKEGIPVGALFLGERKQALDFKRAIDARVNLAPVLNRLFDEDFCLAEWLDQQQVPEAIFDIEMRVDAPTAPHAYLVPIPHPQVVVDIKETPLGLESHIDLIGRQKDATLSIDHRSVSRIHAEIRAINGQYMLRDRGSSNGTYVNMLPLSPEKTHLLQPNDEIRFGDVQFRFQLRQQALNAVNPSIVNKPANLFRHLRGSQLESNTVRIIPPEVFAAVSNTPALILVKKNAEPRIVPVDAQQLMSRRLSIGRDEDNVIVLHDGAASRKHAEIFGAADGLYVHDLNSSNGVFVNKVRISNPYHILHEDRIVIGNTLIYCSLPQVAIQPEAPVPLVNASVKTPLPVATTNKQPVVGLMHRSDIVPLSEKQAQFEINMCIGCDRCMVACPLPSSTQVHIADLNQATISAEIAPHVARFTQECIMCGSCVSVCPVANHRDLLMLSLKQRLGTPWDTDIDIDRVMSALPEDWPIAQLITYMREQPILGDPQLIPENYLLHLFASSQLLTLEAGATIIREGAYGRDLYLLLEGSLSVATMQAKREELQIAVINPGEYIGEYGMLTGQPYPTTVRTLTPSQVLQIPEQVMQHLMELVPQTRSFFEQFNNAHSIEGVLKRMALFEGVSAADIRTLASQSQVQFYDRDECLFSEDDQHTAGNYKNRPARETLHILLEGFVKVARETAEGTGHDKTNERIIAYRQNGDYFAGGLDLMGDGRAVTVSAITRTRVAEIPRETLLGLFAYYPEVDQRFSLRLREYIASTASAQTGMFEIAHLNVQRPSQPADANVRAGLHSLVSNGVVEGTEVLLIDLDKCIHCNECEDACARRHGHSRMNRKGMIVGNISVATACRQCQDPVCMLCSRAGIARRADGEVYITESCIGCGICAERCPYGAISIVDLEEKTVATPSKKRSHATTAKLTGKLSARKVLPMANGATMRDRRVSSGPLDFASPSQGYEEMRKKVAIKCDLCVGYNNQACVQACPTGAAIRVQPTKFFGSTEEILRKRTR